MTGGQAGWRAGGPADRRVGGQAVWRLLALGSLLAGLPLAPAAAQEPPIIIDLEAPIADSLRVAPPPPEVVARLIAAFNDSSSISLVGGFTLPRGSALGGRVVLYRGLLAVHGRLVGSVHVINGDLLVGPTGSIEGDVIVTGGRVRVDQGGAISGSQNRWTEPAPVYRTTSGRLALQEDRRPLGELGSVSRSLYAGGASATFFLGTGRGYNRVEGLPILAGPSLGYQLTQALDLRADARAIVRTTTDPSGIRPQVGFDGRLELIYGMPARAVVGVRLRHDVVPIETQPWSNSEAGWLAFLLRQDARDWYQAKGPELYVEAEPLEGLTVLGGIRHEQEQSVLATNPLSIFRTNETWRANPLIDDGTYTTARVRLGLDTRNNPDVPTSGWLVSGEWEHGTSSDVAPVNLPRAIRDPLPTEGRYRFNRFWLDARRYARIDPDTRLNLRIQGGGWLSGDPLPIQRRVSIGGGDLLPGYGFRARNCNPEQLNDPSRPALCDRAVSVHAEARRRVNLNMLYRLGRS
ncbi:MAG TPA: hypothetical protein VMK53_09980, partial [Gemmatimonadales bacterium]|nr:hypothetical protein [Gemmatimonadales bacterium]